MTSLLSALRVNFQKHMLYQTEPPSFQMLLLDNNKKLRNGCELEYIKIFPSKN